ncbi:MAG TPA: hypothetical protein VJ866_02585 [Pyrinomonadaceae bacterium]|nr:hypothetical protein [Pyrinomonadaceae bacterium]
MPVIGRLDGQVDEVIIKPISDRGRVGDAPADADDATDAPHDAPEPQTPPSTHTQATDESSADVDELPVWLL